MGRGGSIWAALGGGHVTETPCLCTKSRPLEFTSRSWQSSRNGVLKCSSDLPSTRAGSQGDVSFNKLPQMTATCAYIYPPPCPPARCGVWCLEAPVRSTGSSKRSSDLSHSFQQDRNPEIPKMCSGTGFPTPRRLENHRKSV